MVLFYVLNFFKNGATIQGGHYLLGITIPRRRTSFSNYRFDLAAYTDQNDK